MYLPTGMHILTHTQRHSHSYSYVLMYTHIGTHMLTGAHTHPGQEQSPSLLRHADTQDLLIMRARRPAAHTLGIGAVR
jgi:hypothetical protein